jgi:hypothetical protein
MVCDTKTQNLEGILAAQSGFWKKIDFNILPLLGSK